MEFLDNAFSFFLLFFYLLKLEVLVVGYMCSTFVEKRDIVDEF